MMYSIILVEGKWQFSSYIIELLQLLDAIQIKWYPL